MLYSFLTFLSYRFNSPYSVLYLPLLFCKFSGLTIPSLLSRFSIFSTFLSLSFLIFFSCQSLPSLHKFVTACEVNFGCRIDRSNSLPSRGKALLPAHVPVSVGDKLRVLYGPNAKESKVTYEAKVRKGNIFPFFLDWKY